MRIESHWLVDSRKRESPNRGAAIKPRYVILHYSAGRSREETIEWLCSPGAKASAHAVIGRDGTICQLLPFNIKAWHAGVSKWQGLIGLNDYSIGVELENFGRLYKAGNQYRTWFQTEVAGNETVAARHRLEADSGFWHAYTAEQIAAAVELAKLLVDEYELEDILGHDDVAPDRKRDPGPAFPMASFKAKVLGRADDEASWYAVSSDFLNVRSGPGIQHPTICEPLGQGTRLALLERREDWSRVRAEEEGSAGNRGTVEGWVSNWYIHPA